MKNCSTLLALSFGSALLLASCGSTPKNMMVRDSAGNYVTTSDFRAMDRTEFFRSMSAGLADFDEQLADLRRRANELGGETLEEFAECEPELRGKRSDLVNQFAIAQSAMNDSWPDERSETVECYQDLRETLTEAYEDVLGS